MTGNLDGDDVLGDIVTPVGAEGGAEYPAAEEGTSRFVLVPARQFPLGEQPLVLCGLLGTDVVPDRANVVVRVRWVLSTLQAARFYMPALGAISLLGAWLLVSVPCRQPLAAITTLAALFGLGGWAFHDMYQFPSGSQLVVVPGRSSSSQAREPGSP